VVPSSRGDKGGCVGDSEGPKGACGGGNSGTFSIIIIMALSKKAAAPGSFDAMQTIATQSSFPNPAAVASATPTAVTVTAGKTEPVVSSAVCEEAPYAQEIAQSSTPVEAAAEPTLAGALTAQARIAPYSLITPLLQANFDAPAKTGSAAVVEAAGDELRGFPEKVHTHTWMLLGASDCEQWQCGYVFHHQTAGRECSFLSGTGLPPTHRPLAPFTW